MCPLKCLLEHSMGITYVLECKFKKKGCFWFSKTVMFLHKFIQA